MFYKDDKSIELRKVYELAVTVIEAGKLNTAGPADHSKDDLYKKIEPRYFVSWAKSKGISIPDELDGFNEQKTPSDRELTNTDEWMTYEELKERWGRQPELTRARPWRPSRLQLKGEMRGFNGSKGKRENQGLWRVVAIH